MKSQNPQCAMYRMKREERRGGDRQWVVRETPLTCTEEHVPLIKRGKLLGGCIALPPLFLKFSLLLHSLAQPIQRYETKRPAYHRSRSPQDQLFQSLTQTGPEQNRHPPIIVAP